MSDHTPVTAAVVDFIGSAAFEHMPAEAVAIGKRCIIDALGVMLAGSTQEAGSILRGYVQERTRAAKRRHSVPRHSAPERRRLRC